jgi:threonine dehydratase
VQSAAAPAAYRAWRAGTLLEDEMHTFAEGLQTRVAFELPQRIMTDHLDDFVLVSDDEIRHSTIKLIELTRNLIEPAGAAPLAAALRLGADLEGKRIALIATGGNITPSQLGELLAWAQSER